jgi:DNA-binding response OmpR family regulator
MSESISLVLYGRGQRLLDTRRRLLQEAGYPVWTATQIPDVFSIVTEERIDVLILCHTLSPEELAWAIAFADVQSPRIKCIVLNARKSGYRCEVSQDVLDARDQPADLLAAVEGLVSRASSSHSHFY